MKILSLLSRNENAIEIVNELLLLKNVKATATGIEEDLQKHPDYPSLLSISDVLTSYGIDNISIKTSFDELHKLPMPCIAPIVVNEEEKYTIILSVTNEAISYYNPKTMRLEVTSIDYFIKQWRSKILMVINTDEAIGEKDYLKKRRVERNQNWTKTLSFLALPILTFIACMWSIFWNSLVAVLPGLYTISTLAGLISGVILIAYEIDEDNPLLNQICKSGKKVNCSAIINSKASKIAGISWSSIGFIYFSGSLILLLVQGILNPQVLVILTWLNTLALPYIFFSIYYQWRVAKQWCVLCLTVQAILFIQGLITIFAGWHFLIPINYLFKGNIGLATILSFSLPAIVLAIVLPAFRIAKSTKQLKRDLQRFKYNPQIFNTLLKKQKIITESTEGLGITLGSPNPTYKIIKICNPFCGPCAKAHAPIEELLHSNPNVQLQIIFSVSEDSGPKTQTVKHFMAIQEKYGESSVKQALDSWYLAPKKDYNAFAAKFPLNGEVGRQSQSLKDMFAWCEKTQIAFTPTFFVNGHQLPEMYSANDLKNLLSV
jgi:uncharacterized membrane protein